VKKRKKQIPRSARNDSEPPSSPRSPFRQSLTQPERAGDAWDKFDELPIAGCRFGRESWAGL